MIETTVDMEQAGQGDYVIKPDFDETLGGKFSSFQLLFIQIHCKKELVTFHTHLCINYHKTACVLCSDDFRPARNDEWLGNRYSKSVEKGGK